jgi:hypothetical protein
MPEEKEIPKQPLNGTDTSETNQQDVIDLQPATQPTNMEVHHPPI